MNLKGSGKRFIGGVGRRKGKEESCNYNFKTKENKNIIPNHWILYEYIHRIQFLRSIRLVSIKNHLNLNY